MSDNGRVHNYRDEGIVLSGHKLGEADRIVSVLTRSHGLVRAVAKGVRRTKSRFGSRLEPFMLVDLQCHVGRSLDIVTQVELIEPFARGIASDYDVYSAASVMAETASRITEAEPVSRTHFLLLVSAIRSLCNREHPPRLALDAYLLRAMSVAGWAPSLLDCAQCGRPGPHRAFSAGLGGAVCTQCRTSGAALPDTDALEHMAALLTGDWETAESADLHDQMDASKLVTDWVSWHLERNIRSLRVLEST